MSALQRYGGIIHLTTACAIPVDKQILCPNSLFFLPVSNFLSILKLLTPRAMSPSLKNSKTIFQLLLLCKKLIFHNHIKEKCKYLHGKILLLLIKHFDSKPVLSSLEINTHILF